MIKNYIQKIFELAKDINKNVTIMEVCGGHTNVIMKYAIRDILPKNIKLISGPGCPVCVTSQKDIDSMIELANKKIPIATYGDMMHVPGTKMSLEQAKAQGADIKTIISATEMLNPQNKHRVFFAIGFETTTPMTAYLLQNNICVYSTHKIMIPPMQQIVKNSKIDGFIDPGHVSCIIGSNTFKQIKIPQVICGFEKEQIIRAIYKLLKLIKEKKNEVINDYDEVVKPQGNIKAQKIIKQNMKPCDSEWRGLGLLENSGLEPQNNNLNAKIKYKHLLQNINSSENKLCRCTDILKGLCNPQDCKLFGKTCTPNRPMGACMVSQTEGACAITYKYTQNQMK